MYGALRRWMFDLLPEAGQAKNDRVMVAWKNASLGRGKMVMTVVALLAGAQAPVAQPTPKPTVYYLNTSFDNASPLQWQVDEDGTVQVFLLFDYERNSPALTAPRGIGIFRYKAGRVPSCTLR